VEVGVAKSFIEVPASQALAQRDRPISEVFNLRLVRAPKVCKATRFSVVGHTPARQVVPDTRQHG
jgi:hypothetical protein